MNLAGEEMSNKYKPAIWLAGSASAEFFADIALCPLEMTKVKIQTSPRGSLPTAFGAALAEMRNRKIETRYPFGSIVPLWSRQVSVSIRVHTSRDRSANVYQIPYTMAKFFFFEGIVQQFYTHIFTAPKESYSKPTQLGITFTSGYLAGIICAVVSHPADTVVSLMGKADNKGKSIRTIAKETGFLTLATKGLGTRMIMIGTLTGKCCSVFLLRCSDRSVQVSNGGYTTLSRRRWASAQPVESSIALHCPQFRIPVEPSKFTHPMFLIINCHSEYVCPSTTLCIISTP